MHAYLWVGSLSEHVSHCVGVTSEGVYAGLGPHVPHTSGGVPPSSEQHVDGGMQRHAIYSTEMTVVVTYYLGSPVQTEGEREVGWW